MVGPRNYCRNCEDECDYASDRLCHACRERLRRIEGFVARSYRVVQSPDGWRVQHRHGWVRAVFPQMLNACKLCRELNEAIAAELGHRAIERKED